ncbi:hypothetical protein M885DRAFT_500283 [Pelagophyceae sp. CCMP2097]|nr:hypothetical protein M885DRAFT_500283 [Pelagophyceae sp. CCMP2097]
MSEWQRLCHDCAWHMKDAERAKEKKGEEKTDADEKTARLDAAGGDIIHKSLGNCEDALPRESRAHRDRDENAGGAEEDEIRDAAGVAGGGRRMIPSGVAPEIMPRPRLRPLDTTITEATWAASAATSIFSSPVVSAA